MDALSWTTKKIALLEERQRNIDATIAGVEQRRIQRRELMRSLLATRQMYLEDHPSQLSPLPPMEAAIDES